MGGHEHHNMLVNEGNSLISKTDANAKSIYIHTFTYNTELNELSIESELFPIDDRIASNHDVEVIVSKWVGILEMKLKDVVEDPFEVIYVSEIPFDGTDSASRGIQTNLGEMITEAMAWSFENKVDAALVNGGSIRIDDILPNELSVVDVFRILPFGGGILKVELKGNLLTEVLDYGKEQRGTGAYLQRYNVGVDPDTGDWLLGGEPINSDKTYTVAFSDFLLKGFDIPFLTPENKDVLNIYTPTNDEIASNICKSIILYLKSLKNKS
jgi:2',3'-cyclic-nucleotide 2'-phosphodiesterase (5'-nucleotidase family)